MTGARAGQCRSPLEGPGSRAHALVGPVSPPTATLGKQKALCGLQMGKLRQVTCGPAHGPQSTCRIGDPAWESGADELVKAQPLRAVVIGPGHGAFRLETEDKAGASPESWEVESRGAKGELSGAVSCAPPGLGLELRSIALASHARGQERRRRGRGKRQEVF